jgi:acyl-CoA synthetase (AMP-forming)/AMP-acid ligase II/aryl carrier-like protein
LILAGELMTNEDKEAWAPYVDLKNTYGPAECSTTSTGLSLGQEPMHVGNIGHGLGLVTWVIEHTYCNGIAPIGTVGELWLEGPLVGAGYLNDSQKTAAAFIEDPPWLLSGGPGYTGRRGRLYKTGDLVQYNSDGTLTFIGRKDAQVKIRGQRVELGDVEHHVRHGLIADGVIQVVAEVIIPQGSDSPMLVAFVDIGEAANGSRDEVKAVLKRLTRDLEEKLAEQLPAYMVPTAYIPIEKMPMTATGKTDRRRLREIGGLMTLEQLAELNPSRSKRREPSTKMERQLQELWASVLSIDTSSIGADDSFLRIGGDSIGAMRLVGAARAQGLSLTEVTIQIVQLIVGN